jgi:hypothetical protein
MSNTFKDGLEALGYVVEEVADRKLCFDYEIPMGSFAGRKVKLGFENVQGFPVSVPSGPHISPRLLDIDPGDHARGRVNPSSFGDDWIYLSRPFQSWNETTRTVEDYMSFLRKMFLEL